MKNTLRLLTEMVIELRAENSQLKKERTVEKVKAMGCEVDSRMKLNRLYKEVLNLYNRYVTSININYNGVLEIEIRCAYHQQNLGFRDAYKRIEDLLDSELEPWEYNLSYSVDYCE